MDLNYLIVTCVVAVLHLVAATQATSHYRWLHQLKARNTFKRQQQNHRISTLSDNQLNILSSLSDKTYFKETLLAPILIVRPPGSEGNIKVQKHIKSNLQNLGWTIEEDSFQDSTPYGIKPFTNIIATFNPDARRTLTLACHFDSKYYENIEFIGATDSAVPCAMLLDLAKTLDRYLKAGNGVWAWDVTLQFLFFDGEEAYVNWTPTDSIYGARHLASKMHSNVKRVGRDESVPEIATMDALVLLDLIGAKDPIFRNWFKDTEHHFTQLSEAEMRLAHLGKLEPRDSFVTRRHNKYFLQTSALGGGIQDDHIPFLNKGVPVLHVIAYPFPKVWHTVADDESAIDYEVVDNLNKILRVYVAQYLHLNIN